MKRQITWTADFLEWLSEHTTLSCGDSAQMAHANLKYFYEGLTGRHSAQLAAQMMGVEYQI